MIRSYLTISLRNLTKRKAYTVLNVLGLTIGVACCLLIFQYVSRERNFDTFEKNSGQIVRLRVDQYKQGKLEWQSATVFPAIAPTLKKEFPEVENTCRLLNDGMLLSNDQRNIKFNETKGYYADPSAIGMLGFDLVRGSEATALVKPFDMVISQSMAKKYFGTDDVIGRTLTARDNSGSKAYEVSGVFKDYPATSHLVVSYLVSYATLVQVLTEGGDKVDVANTGWGWYDFYEYIQLRPGTNLQAFQAKLPAFADKRINSNQWLKANNTKDWLYIMPLHDLHLYSNYNEEAEVNGNGSAVSFMFLIALIIMGIAWINYINLSTARSVERAKEVGVRKVLGAGKFQLVKQFMLENILLNTAAIIIAAVLVYAFSGPFNQLMGTITFPALR